ncbi:MAG TPA: flagellar hook-basal body complex protein FliE [Planctomycetaceae bacterium]|nr:flagellar hook-basal body complex protein FliE [Planctomycetaceae bacterium]
MADPIRSVNSLPALGLPGNPIAAPAASPVSFQELLMKSLEQVQQLDANAQQAIEGGLVNGDLTQAEVFTAMKKVDLSYRMMIQIRNKLMDAYQEVQQLRM